MFFVVIAFVTLSVTVFFNIDHFSVKGVSAISTETILDVSGVKKGDNLLRLSMKEIQKKILEKTIQADKVSVRRKLPSTLEITVTEAKPFANIKQGETYSILSQGGRIIKSGLSEKNKDVLTIIGADFPNAKVGDFIDMAKDEKLQTLEKINTALKENKIEGIKGIDVTNIVDISLNYRDRVTIQIGSISEISYKLLFAKEVLENRENNSVKGILDARNPGKVYFNPSSD
jgi:cell division septal protein FtsQ